MEGEKSHGWMDERVLALSQQVRRQEYRGWMEVNWHLAAHKSAVCSNRMSNDDKTGCYAATNISPERDRQTETERESSNVMSGKAHTHSVEQSSDYNITMHVFMYICVNCVNV